MKKYNQLLLIFSFLALTSCSSFLEKNVQVEPATGHRVCDDINRELTFNMDQTDEQDNGTAFLNQARLLNDYKSNSCEKFETDQ